MKKGFTLAELLAVTVLLALLVAISYPVLFNSFNEEKENLEEAELELIYSAAKNYIKLNRSDYPTDVNSYVCIFLNDLIDEDLVAIDLDDTFRKRIVKVKMLENNKFQADLLLEGEKCTSKNIEYEVKSCKEKKESNSNYEITDNKVQYIVNGSPVRQISYISAKNNNSSSSASYDLLAENYSNLYEVLKNREEYTLKLNKGKNNFSMVVSIETMVTYNNLSSDEMSALNSASIFYSNGSIDLTCD